jgi:hypothetical protein
MVKFPTGAAAIRSINAFKNFGGLPQIVGAIDGTHFHINRPG